MILFYFFKIYLFKFSTFISTKFWVPNFLSISPLPPLQNAEHSNRHYHQSALSSNIPPFPYPHLLFCPVGQDKFLYPITCIYYFLVARTILNSRSQNFEFQLLFIPPSPPIAFGRQVVQYRPYLCSFANDFHNSCVV